MTGGTTTRTTSPRTLASGDDRRAPARREPGRERSRPGARAMTAAARGVDPVLAGALTRFAEQSPANRRLWAAVADLFDAGGDRGASRQFREGVVDDPDLGRRLAAAADDLIAEGRRLLAEPVRESEDAKAERARTVFRLWDDSAKRRRELAVHQAPILTRVMVEAASMARQMPELVAPGADQDGAILTFDDFIGWWRHRCHRILDRAVGVGDDGTASGAVLGWGRVVRAYARSDPYVPVLGREVELELQAELVRIGASAIGVGPAAARSAGVVVSDWAPDGDSWFGMLEAPKLWATAITAAIAMAERRGVEPAWWRSQDGRDFLVEPFGVAAVWSEATLLESLLPVELPARAPVGADALTRRAGDDVAAILTGPASRTRGLSFVARSEVTRCGVCWPPVGEPPTDGPSRMSPPAAVSSFAASLGVEVLGLYETPGFHPPPVSPALGFGPFAVPDLAAWDELAAAAGTSVRAVVGALSVRGLQLVVVIADPVALPVAAADWVTVFTEPE